MTQVGASIFTLLNLSGYQSAAFALGILIGGSGVDFLFGYFSNYLQGINRAPGLALLCIGCLVPILIGVWYFDEKGNAQVQLLFLFLIMFY